MPSTATGASRSRRPAPSGRGIEEVRRERLRTLRTALAAEGYDGTVRLIHEGVGFVIALSPEPGIDERRLRHVVESRRLDDVEDMLSAARRLADLAGIAGRRAAAIVASGNTLTDPPAWAYLGHPVARGAYAAMGLDMATFLPRRTPVPLQSNSGMRINEFRISVANQRARRGDLTITVDADQDVARVRILGGSWPETIVSAMPGRAVGDILGLQGLERGTRAGDAPIGQVWTESGGVGFTVACALEPMGIVPEGVDTGFLEEWSQRHFV